MGNKSIRVLLPTDTVQIGAQITVQGKELVRLYANEKRISISQLIIFLIERELDTKEPLSPRFN